MYILIYLVIDPRLSAVNQSAQQLKGCVFVLGRLGIIHCSAALYAKESQSCVFTLLCVCMCVFDTVHGRGCGFEWLSESSRRGVGSLSIWPQLTLPSQRHGN